MTDVRDRWEARYAVSDERPPYSTPSPFMMRCLPLLPAGRALDIACGDGRNSLALAEHGLAVDAIDIAFLGLARLRAAAQRQDLSIALLQADLERFRLPVSRYDVIVNVRYLQRSLFDSIRSAVVPGGLVVFETFLRQQASLGHPKNPAFLLEPGELRAHFSDFEVLIDEEGVREEDSPPAFLARLLARRPL